MSATSRRVIVGKQVVAQYDGDNVVICAQIGNRRRTYVLSPTAGGCRLTVTIGGTTEEIPLPKMCAVA